MLEGCLDVEGMQIKKRLIGIRQRWDLLYHKTVEHEKKVKADLKPIEEFQTASSKFELWLQEIKLKQEDIFVGVSSVEEVQQQFVACQVRMGYDTIRYDTIRYDTIR